jgi:hypothetical protein
VGRPAESEEDGEVVGGGRVGSVGGGIDFAYVAGDGNVAQTEGNDDAGIGAHGGDFAVGGGLIAWAFGVVIYHHPLSWAGYGLHLDEWALPAAAVVYSLDGEDGEWIDS